MKGTTTAETMQEVVTMREVRVFGLPRRAEKCRMVGRRSWTGTATAMVIRICVGVGDIELVLCKTGSVNEGVLAG